MSTVPSPSSMPLPPLTLIVAATRNNGIGLTSTNALPWRLPREMAYFARVTAAAPPGTINAVVMGRNTWESIPLKFRPLKDRWNVVLSRREMPELKSVPNTIHLQSISDLLANPTPVPLHRVFVIGGASIYTSVLSNPSLRRILMTRVLEPNYSQCDVHFPEFRSSKQVSEDEASGDDQWRRASHAELEEWVGGAVPSGVQEEKGTKYEFQMWVMRDG